MRKILGFLVGLAGMIFAMMCWCYVFGFVMATGLVFTGWLLAGGKEIINEG